jgi:hypothetical protein
MKILVYVDNGEPICDHCLQQLLEHVDNPEELLMRAHHGPPGGCMQVEITGMCSKCGGIFGSELAMAAGKEILLRLISDE